MNKHIGSDLVDWVIEQDFLDLLSRDIEDGNVQPIPQELFESIDRIKAPAQKNIEEMSRNERGELGAFGN
mgnify:CR=1 FL=1